MVCGVFFFLLWGGGGGGGVQWTHWGVLFRKFKLIKQPMNDDGYFHL